MRTDKHEIEPFGSNCGLAGSKGACIVDSGRNDEKRLPSRFGDYRLGANDLVRIVRPGGGGLGDPLRRPVDKVIDDVRQGYVTVARARSDYGVAVRTTDGELRLDDGETAILRGKN